MKLFDEKLYICETCHKNLNKNGIPCQPVCNKPSLDPILDELKNLKKKNRKVLISKRILFKKIAVMHGKGELFKIKRSICNISIETANIWNTLPRSAVSNELIAVIN